MARKTLNPAPTMPDGMNGDHAAIWDQLHHVDNKVDRNFFRLVMFILSSSAVSTSIVLGAVFATK